MKRSLFTSKHLHFRICFNSATNMPLLHCQKVTDINHKVIWFLCNFDTFTYIVSLGCILTFHIMFFFSCSHFLVQGEPCHMNYKYNRQSFPLTALNVKVHSFDCHHCFLCLQLNQVYPISSEILLKLSQFSNNISRISKQVISH